MVFFRTLYIEIMLASYCIQGWARVLLIVAMLIGLWQKGQNGMI